MASPAGNRVNALVLTFTLVSGIVVFFRIFTRVAVIKNAGLEDVCITLAMAFSIGLSVMIAEQIRNGMGSHIFELTRSEILNSQKAFWASVWIYYLSLTFTKVSILVQYLRIFPTRKFQMACIIVLGFVVAFGIWGFFGSVFLCFPVQFFWDKRIEGGKCLDQFGVWFSNAGLNIIQDFLILLLPMPVLRRLVIPKKQKRALIVVFALGGFVCVVSVVRLQSLIAISNSTDPTFDNPPAAALSAVETNVGIITACLPSLRPLFSAMMPSYFPASERISHGRPRDEEKAMHPRKLSVSTRPPTASTRPPTAGTMRTGPRVSHSRSGSATTYSTRTDSEPGVTYVHQARIARPVTRLNSPARQVHIRSTSRESSLSRLGAPKLPRLPENIATIGTVDMVEYQPRHYRSISSAQSMRPHSRSSRASRISRTSRTPVFQKPLPITPFPVNMI